MDPKFFRLAQLVLTALILIFSLAIIGTAAHTLSSYNKNHLSNPWWAPLWPDHFDINGTKGLIGAAVTVVLLNTLYLILSFLPQFHLAGRPTFRAFVTICTVLPGAFAMLSTVIYAHVLNGNSPEMDSIQTWTCMMKGADPNASNDVPKDLSNSEFGKLCTESKFALYTSLTVFLLQVVLLALVVVGWVADQLAKRKTKKESEWQDASSLEMNAQGHPPAY